MTHGLCGEAVNDKEELVWLRLRLNSAAGIATERALKEESNAQNVAVQGSPRSERGTSVELFSTSSVPRESFGRYLPG